MAAPSGTDDGVKGASPPRPALRPLIYVVGGVSVVLLGLSAWAAPFWPGIGIGPEDWPVQARTLAGLAFWIGIELIAAATYVRTPSGNLVGVGTAPLIAATLLGGPTAGAVVALIGLTEWREIRTGPWYGIMANHAAGVLSALAGGVVYSWLAGPTLERLVVAGSVAGVVVVATGAAAMASLVAVRDDRPLRWIATEVRGELGTSRLGLVAIGILMAAAGQTPLLVAICLVPMRALSTTFVRILEGYETEHLQRSLEREKEAHRAEGIFLATMSHEIRTPLNAIIGMSELLREGDLSAQDRESAAAIATAGRSLLRIVDDILDFSRIEAGRVELESIAFDPRSFAGEIARLFAAPAAAKGLALKVSVGTSVPGSVRGDPTRIRQVVGNLLGNAIKFTSTGSITLTVDYVRDPRSTLRWVVADSGIGIAPEEVERLFNPFSQADASTTRRFGGTGLGLAISRRLTEIMGGTIALESTEGRGTTVTVEVPVELARAEARRPADRPLTADRASTGVRVLVAEDNRLNQLVVVRMLERLHAVPLVVETGQAVLDALETTPIDLILMDWHMPDLDGMAATAVIRGRSDELASIPIVAVTADAFVDGRRACLAAGMNDVVVKPIDLATLEMVLARWAPKAAGRIIDGDAVVSSVPVRWTADVVLDPVTTERLLALDSEGGTGFLAGLNERFVALAHETVPAIDAAIAVADAAALEEAAHKLKGGAGSVGAAGVHDRCRDLLALARTGTTSGAEATTAELKVALRAATAALGALVGLSAQTGRRAPRAATRPLARRRQRVGRSLSRRRCGSAPA